MAIIFITGLSGVGKTSVLNFLAEEGYSVVDTDVGYTAVIETDYGTVVGLDEGKIKQLIADHQGKELFISGCYANQGKFYDSFDHVVLLTADLDVSFERIQQRTSHDYGKSPADKAEILDNHTHILPLLKKGSDLIIDTTDLTIKQVSTQLKTLLEK